ncbi:thioredoxin family protein [Paenibacillus bouchesdurhonensis]|uniref:thioredoxin family protein n=1 Tax=Paenibacillus bouchesdurhonensis TaxID=1870990 RepID=UPI000DA62E3A|nr:thioredoxin family protein [Paenibacillus bouchesdurhonensis]
MQRLYQLSEINQVIQEHALVLLLIKTSQCGVCESIQAKAEGLLGFHKKVKGIYVFMEDAPNTAAEYLALSAPTLLLFCQGKEVYRESRFVRFEELELVLHRYEEALEEL